MIGLGASTDAVSASFEREGSIQTQSPQAEYHLHRLQHSENTCKGKR